VHACIVAFQRQPRQRGNRLRSARDTWDTGHTIQSASASGSSPARKRNTVQPSPREFQNQLDLSPIALPPANDFWKRGAAVSNRTCEPGFRTRTAGGGRDRDPP
jgi:hypothetical protein